MNELFSGFFLIIGAFFILIAGIGLVRFPDIYTRMHAVSKSMTLGIGSILLGVVVYFMSWSVGMKAFLTIVFLYMTMPIAGQLISFVAYHRQTPMWEKSVIDDYASRDQSTAQQNNGSESINA